MSRELRVHGFVNDKCYIAGITKDTLVHSVRAAYLVLDAIDETLLRQGLPRLSRLVELANLSSMVGNILANEIVKASSSLFRRAGAHKYQDLRATDPRTAEDIEVKVALESNKPKGHLPKEGCYLTFRYVLAGCSGEYKRGDRQDVVWIWEIRLGRLSKEHFNLSNTTGDSGKTAVVNASGLGELRVLYFDDAFSPYASPEAYRNRAEANITIA